MAAKVVAGVQQQWEQLLLLQVPCITALKPSVAEEERLDSREETCNGGREGRGSMRGRKRRKGPVTKMMIMMMMTVTGTVKVTVIVAVTLTFPVIVIVIMIVKVTTASVPIILSPKIK